MTPHEGSVPQCRQRDRVGANAGTVTLGHLPRRSLAPTASGTGAGCTHTGEAQLPATICRNRGNGSTEPHHGTGTVEDDLTGGAGHTGSIPPRGSGTLVARGGFA